MAISAHLARAVKRHDRTHRAVRRMRFAIGHFMPARHFAGVPGRIHFNDFMFLNSSPEELASYIERAGNVIQLIDEVLSAAGKTTKDFDTWLDFGCGYGRVIRFLAERVPREQIFASDVIREGVNFCQSEFGVHPVYSSPDLASVKLGSYDFIYAVSVITHLNEQNSREFLRLLGESLNPGGIAMFTTHGEWSIEHIAEYGDEYALKKTTIGEAVRERGIAFIPYSFVGDDYGMTWHSKEYIEARMDEAHGECVAPLLFRPHGLDGHQDVHAFQRCRTGSARRTA